MAEHLRPDEVGEDIRKQQRMLEPAVQSRFIREVVGPLMTSMVSFNFLRGKDPNGKTWKSWAAKTKFGGRWSLEYDKRPSGTPVTADKTRLVDTGALADSYKEKTRSARNVIVGPTGSTHEKVAENEEKHGNFITGWGNDALRALAAEMQEFVNRMALGRYPQSRPVSTVGRRAGL